jgi:hypothetical protein
MADYYPLIARAIAGLDPNAPGESRRALYERARAALIQQLRSVQPPLSESEITRGDCRWKRPCARARRRPPSAPATPPSGGGARGGDAFRRANAGAPADAPAPGAPPRPHPDTAAVAGQRPSAAQPSSRCARPAAWPQAPQG